MRNLFNILVIFDEDVNLTSFQKKLSEHSPKSIDLFPLTSNWRLIYDIESATRNLFSTDIEIKLIDSAELINKEVDVIRDKISKWSADLGNKNIAGKSIKEWFLLPEGEVSAWWFSLLSEKNSRKTNVFFRLAQLQAIQKFMYSNSLDLCFASTSEKILSKSIEDLCKRNDINIFHISSFKRKKTLKIQIKSFLDRQNTYAIIMKAFIHLIIRYLRAIRAKLVLGAIKNRVKVHSHSILFVSYFPAVDKKSARYGILKNKYAIPLQKKLAEMERNIIWIWMYWFIDEYSYSDALKLAKKFKKNGELNFFLDEFLSLRALFRVLFSWFRQLRIFLKLRRLMPIHSLYKDLSIPEGAVYIRNLMECSFIGWTGVEGILFFESFKKVFSFFQWPSHCIYCLEMQAWEKALNAAKQLKAPQVKSIGFIHAAIFRNQFLHLNHPSEIIQEEKSMILPLPNIIGCNGDISLDIMSQCRYPGVTKVEAIRHLYINNYLDNLNLIKKQNTVLIAGSIDVQATIALFSFFYETFPNPRKFKVWLKGHPALPFEEILRDLRIDVRKCGYMIKHDPIDKLLKSVKILIVGSSAVAIEGLAAGCKVITPIFSDNMFISPLDGFEEFYTKVRNPQEMRTAIEQSIQCNERKQDLNEIKEFISQYFCLDPSLQRWEKLLTESSIV